MTSLHGESLTPRVVGPGSYVRPPLSRPEKYERLAFTFCRLGTTGLIAWAVGPAVFVLVVAIIAPLLVSVIVRTFGWVVVLGESGFMNSVLRALGFTALGSRTHLFNETAVLVGLVHVFLPFMVLAIYGALQKQQSRIVDAARNLGATATRAFLAVTLPLSLAGVVAGTTTVFAMATGAYVTVAVLGGSKVMVMSMLAYQQSLGLANWKLGAAIGVVLLVGTTAIIQIFLLVVRRLMPRALGV